MSDEARNYVKKNSPYEGQTFWLHYVLGDIANQQHDYELWIGEKALMNEWPFKRSAIVRGYSQLIADGFLEVLEKPAPGRKARYRFVFLDVESNGRNVTRSATRSTNVTRGARIVSHDAKRSPIYLTEKNSNSLEKAILEICNMNPNALTASASKQVSEAAKELAEVDATPETIRAAGKKYRSQWPEVQISPVALARHYPSLVMPEAVRTASRAVSGQTCPSCAGTGWEHYGEANTVVRCRACSATRLEAVRATN